MEESHIVTMAEASVPLMIVVNNYFANFVRVVLNHPLLIDMVMKKRFAYIITFTILCFCVACGSKGKKEEQIDREAELEHYFSGVSEIVTDSASPLIRAGGELATVIIDVKDLNLHDAGTDFNLIKVIKLQTTRNNLIGSVDKLIYADSTFFILDRDMGKSIYSFDSEGNFIATIGFSGRGPEEYIEPTDIFYDEVARNVVVWDQFTHRFLSYSRSGEFIYSRGVPLRFLRCERVPGSESIWCSHLTVNGGVDGVDGYNLISTDSLCSRVEALFDLNPLVMNYVPIGTNMRVLGNSLYYHPQFSDTIYKIDESVVSPSFLLDFKNIPALPRNLMELCEGNYERFMEQFASSAVAYFENDFLITDRNIYFEVNIGADVITVCYPYSSEGADNEVSVLMPNIYNLFRPDHCQACNLPWGNMQSCSYSNGNLYAAVNSSLISLLTKEELSYLNLMDLDEDGNPVILVMQER